MHEAPPQFAGARPAPAVAAAPGRLERFGLWLRDHQREVRALQWAMVALYLPLLILPALLPLPDATARIWSNLTLFAQFLFWGIWWPGVLVSVLLFGRLWCGLLCPEGALSAAASRRGKGRAIPRWMKWPGWPFALFAGVTIYGQMISIYDDPRAALLILGLSSGSAVLVGWLYGREKRVWCRFLCPVNGVFGLLAKLAPMHYRVDGRAWDACPPSRAREMRFNCEPMVPVRTMDSASPCHMCGRCAGFRDAVRLEPRAPGSEVLRSAGSAADSLMVIAGLIGLGSAAFWWETAPWLGPLSRALGAAVEAPWALFGRGMTLGEGAALLLTFGLIALPLSAAVALSLALAARLDGRSGMFHRLALALLPLSAAGLIVGLSQQTVARLAASGLPLDARAVWTALLLLGAGWSLRLAAAMVRRRPALGAVVPAIGVPLAVWAAVIWA
ncbi:4Fe-4S binding protein [Cereibacter sphaeroides]|uniref:4Fe-4S binding protein n=1 Tax=Cereibacter sphaeroides TaxID=1063 RepID=UPI001F20F4CD|nr:4Fe-4S binding protein [Cereibacter sphaeroides]MCE6957834.1 4Fe-4S binding protein [Cereibacter sphaeroides]MCE6969538.1 4Fe-4S binding protein [Cereibacter sphaeroides]MCE6972704.1 4Fe-4S binding protein [Cereibacter sphaeroides]